MNLTEEKKQGNTASFHQFVTKIHHFLVKMSWYEVTKEKPTCQLISLFFLNAASQDWIFQTFSKNSVASKKSTQNFKKYLLICKPISKTNSFLFAANDVGSWTYSKKRYQCNKCKQNKWDLEHQKITMMQSGSKIVIQK